MAFTRQLRGSSTPLCSPCSRTTRPVVTLVLIVSFPSRGEQCFILSWCIQVTKRTKYKINSQLVIQLQWQLFMKNSMVYLNYDLNSLISYNISSTSQIKQLCIRYCKMNKKEINFVYKSSSCTAFAFLPNDTGL